ncbi:MAG TPA: hypothetical protein VHL34_17610 [Rhizomicrobium sp.]|nr:hypothetical protein [Rhizomicrobium sp.]
MRPARFGALAVAFALAGCAWPTHDEATLKGVAVACQHLMTTEALDTDYGPYPKYSGVPQKRWPPAIASLHPQDVSVFQTGCDIQIKPMFDGGWGYFVPRARGQLPEPRGRYTDLGYGVYWYRPD